MKKNFYTLVALVAVTGVAGSEMYPGAYGAYNFAAQKTASAWKVTSWVGCRRM